MHDVMMLHSDWLSDLKLGRACALASFSGRRGGRSGDLSDFSLNPSASSLILGIFQFGIDVREGKNMRFRMV